MTELSREPGPGTKSIRSLKVEALGLRAAQFLDDWLRVARGWGASLKSTLARKAFRKIQTFENFEVPLMNLQTANFGL